MGEWSHPLRGPNDSGGFDSPRGFLAPDGASRKMGLDRFAPDDDDEQDEERPPLCKPGALADGESMTFEVGAEPETFEHDDYGEGERIPAIYVDAEHDGDFKGEGPFEAGEEVTVVFWSKRLGRELYKAVQELDGSLVGEELTIYAHQSDPDRSTSRQYSVEVADE